MVEIILKTENPEEVTQLVKTAINSEIRRLENSKKIAKKRLEYFEEKYQNPSRLFQDILAAEDMEGGDLEYVEWMGEYQFFFRT